MMKARIRCFGRDIVNSPLEGGQGGVVRKPRRNIERGRRHENTPLTPLQGGIFIAGIFILLFCLTAHSQARLYITLVQSRGYVVGAKLTASGLHRYEGGQTWTHLGWNNPRVISAACDPNDSSIVFLACGNGAARSSDGGKTWRMITDWRVTEVQDVCVDPNAPQHVYLATAYGVWASRNRGETWREANAGLHRKYAQSVAVDRTQTQRVFAATESGIFLSTEGARNWTLVGPNDVSILDLEQSAAAPNIWIAATQDRGVLLSNDNGKSWQFANGKLARAAIYAVAIDPFNAQHMSAAAWHAGAFVSEDGGKTWHQRNAGLPVRNLLETVFDANQAGRLWIATFEEGIFYSDDLGRTWSNAGMHGAIVFDMVFVPAADEK